MKWQCIEFEKGKIKSIKQADVPIMEYCYYCRKETETEGLPGGDCKVCGFSKVTPEHLKEKNNETRSKTSERQNAKRERTAQ